MTTPDSVPFKIKANDRLPIIQAQLGFVDTAQVPGLPPGTVVNFIMRVRGVDGTPGGQGTKVNSPAIIVDEPSALVAYAWKVGDTDTPGRWLVEWEVVTADGKTQTFPTDGYNEVLIYADLDGAP